jgi:hypothetical protein
MGDFVIGIVGLVTIFGAIYLFQKGTSALGKKANQTVFMRGSHREGQELVSRQLTCHVNAGRDAVRKAILATVQVAPQVPAVIADAYLIEATDTYILYGHGNKLRQTFRGMLRIVESTNGKATVVWDIVDWTEGDGIVGGRSVMKRLIADINTALRSVDPNATLR